MTALTLQGSNTNTATWFPDMVKRFTTQCKRSRILDPAVAEQRKAEPLYRDLSTNKGAVRAKYLDDALVDCKSVAMSMIRNMDFANSRKLAEFVTCRSGIGRSTGMYDGMRQHSILSFGRQTLIGY